MTPLGILIKQLREERGLQQTQVALGAGMSTCYLSSLESGKKCAPSDEILKRIADQFDLKEGESNKLKKAAEVSHRKYVVPEKASLHEQLMVAALWKQLGSITERQASSIELILKAKEE